MLLLFYNVSHIVEMVPFEVVAGGDCVISNSGGVSLKCQPSSLSYLPEEGSGRGGGGGKEERTAHTSDYAYTEV